MKKILVLIVILISSNVLAHMDHYKKYNKIEMDIFRNGELIGYNYYFFTRKGDETLITNQIKFSVKSGCIRKYALEFVSLEFFI